MLDYGLKVSTPTNDVATQSDQDVAFSTKFSTLKIVKAGDISVTTDGSGNGTSSVTHSLGYAPAYFAYQKATADWSFMDASTYANAYIISPGANYDNWSDGYHHTLHVYTDSSKIYLQAYGAAPSTTYTIHYVLLLDLAQDYSGASTLFDKNIGFKVSKEGIDVNSAKPYELAFTSRCKSIQYYPENYKTETLSLPAMWASPVDTNPQEGTYVDFLHGLGYPPLFLAFFSTTGSYTDNTKIPYHAFNGVDVPSYFINAFCDSTRVRVSFYRSSMYTTAPDPTWAAETITVRCYIFTEDLSQSF